MTRAIHEWRKARRHGLVGLLVLIVLCGGGMAWAGTRGTDAVLRHLDLVDATVIAVDAHLGRAIVGQGARGAVSVVETRGGHLLRTVSLRHYFSGPIVIAQSVGHTFVLSDLAGYNRAGTTVTMLDTRTGTLLHTVTVFSSPAAAAVDEQNGRVFVASDGAPGVGTPGGGLGRVSILDARTGAVLHSAPVGRAPQALAVDPATQRVFVANMTSNTVSVLDSRSGRLVHTVPVGVSPSAVAVDVRTHRVFVANAMARTVSILDARSGVALHTTPVGPVPVAVGVDGGAGHVLVMGAGGAVSVLDATSGAVVVTSVVGANASALALDTRTHRAFITGATATGLRQDLYSGIHRLLPFIPGTPFGQDDGSYVTVVDTLSGTVVRSVPVWSYQGVAVDDQTGHAFVTGNGVSMLDMGGAPSGH